ncbi:hypothetical protein DFJ74DRAFT_714178 [Hyaloraphidium curvatum]|nr:hypothetical protein DFJ74DRAFT_714178 [Hyaloraphidium curvatum]
MPASKWADLNKILQCYSWEGKWVPAPPGDPANATYLWAPGNCGRPWKRYSPRGLCRLLDGRKLGLVGDSMTRYVLHALDAKLTAGGPWAAPEAAWQTPGRTGSSLHPRSSPSSAPPSSDPFCGNDTDPHLLPTPPPLPDWHIGRYNKTIVVNICTPPQPLQPGDADFKCAYMLYNRADRLLVDGDPRATVNYYYSDFPWSTGLAGFPGVLVLNRGSHYENDTLYVSSWRSALSHLRRAAPRAIVFARTTPPGHENCSLIRAPLDVPQPWCGLPHHWGSFYRQNHLLGALLRDEFPGVILLDVSFATALRGDGHKGGADCLHYVTWEAGNAWADMLGNALEMVYEAAGVEVGRKEEGRVGCG